MMRFKTGIGLDMDARTVKAVVLRRRGPWVRMLRSERLRLPDHPEEAAEILRLFVSKNGWTGLPCVLGIGGDKALLRLLTQDRRDTRPSATLVGEHLEHFRSLSTGPTVEDYTVLRGGDGTRRILLAVARHDTEAYLVDRAERAGLRVVGLMPKPLALFSAIRRYAGWSPSPLVCVGIGREGTDVVIGQGRTPLFLGRFEVGSENAPPDATGDAWNRWLLELRSCLKLFSTEQPDRTLRRLVLCGGSSGPTDLCARVEQATGLRAVRVQDLRCARREVHAEWFCGARGLALAGVGGAGWFLNLLPPPVRERMVLRWQFKYWLGSAAAAVAAVLLVGLSLRRDLAHNRRHHEERVDLLATLHREDALLDSYLDRNAALRRQIAPLEIAARNADVLRSVLHSLAEVKHVNDWIVLVADAHSYFDSGSTPAAGTPNGAGRQEALAEDSLQMSVMVVEGYTPVGDLSTVRAMIEALRRRPYISGADLLGDDKLADHPERDERWAPIEGRLFAVEIKIAYR